MSDVKHTRKRLTMRTVPTSIGVCHRIYPESWGEPPSHGGICAYDDHPTPGPYAEGEQKAAAEYIVASFNACHDAGLSTEALEAGVVKDLVDALEALYHGPCGSFDPKYLPEMRRAQAALRAAHGKARDEQAEDRPPEVSL